MTGQAKNDEVQFGRSGTKAAALREWAYVNVMAKQAAGQLPTTARFLFYEAAGEGVVVKKSASEKGRRGDQDLTEALVWLRDEGLIPWDAIVDPTRHMQANWCWTSVPVGLSKIRVRLNPFSTVNSWERPMVIVESESLGSVLTARVGSRYSVPIVPVKGQCGSAFLRNVVGPESYSGQTVVYLGDWDKAGRDIAQSVRTRLEEIVGGQLDWRHVGLHEEQVYELNLRSKIVEAVDKRHRPPLVYEKCEAEAVPQETLIGWVTDVLDELLLEPLESVRRREHEEEQAMDRLLAVAIEEVENETLDEWVEGIVNP